MTKEGLSQGTPRATDHPLAEVTLMQALRELLAQYPLPAPEQLPLSDYREVKFISPRAGGWKP